MMFSAKLFTIVAAVLAVAVNGSPIGGANPGVTPSNPNGSSTKNLGGQSKTDPNHKDGGKAATRTFTYYVNVNFDESQPHGQLTAADGACADLPESFLNAVSSVKYDGTGPCTLYSGAGCTLDNVALTSASISDLGTLGFDNKLASVKCAAA